MLMRQSTTLHIVPTYVEYFIRSFHFVSCFICHFELPKYSVFIVVFFFCSKNPFETFTFIPDKDSIAHYSAYLFRRFTPCWYVANRDVINKEYRIESIIFIFICLPSNWARCQKSKAIWWGEKSMVWIKWSAKLYSNTNGNWFLQSFWHF